jgi:hypothetical protein
VLSLAGCAGNPPAAPGSHSQSWADYRAQVASERDSGALTPLQAEAKIEARFRELNGQDSTMEGAFAYRRELYAQAQADNLPTAEAKALAKTRLDEALVQSKADAHEESDIPDLAQDRSSAEPE